MNPGDEIILPEGTKRRGDPLASNRIATVHAHCPPYIITTEGDSFDESIVCIATAEEKQRLQLIKDLRGMRHDAYLFERLARRLSVQALAELAHEIAVERTSARNIN